MIYIGKNTEPASFTQYRATTNAHFDDMPGEIKKKLRESLLKEQGLLCAYCMKHIDKEADIKIEHYEARNSGNELTYKNLLVVCKGNEGSRPQEQTCDTKKGNNVLHISPQKAGDMDTIYYESQGGVRSINLQYNDELKNVLNLNYPYGYLMSNRKAALEALKEKMRKLPSTGDLQRYIDQLWKRYAEVDGHGEYKEYVGILRWYLQKKKS